MKTFLVALPGEWEERLGRALAGRGHEPSVLRHFADEEILRSDDAAMVCFPAEGAAEEALEFCRRLRERRGVREMQIMVCVAEPLPKEAWLPFRRAGVNFVMAASFSDGDVDTRLRVAEYLLSLRSSPPATIAGTGNGIMHFELDKEDVPYGLLLTSFTNQFVKVNDGLAHILGYASKEELMRVDLARDIYFDPEDRAWLIANSPSRNKSIEVVWKRRDGSPVPISLSAHVVYDEEAGTPFLQGVVWDISEQKRSQELLRMQRDLGIALSRVSSLRETIDIVLDTAFQIEGVDCGGFFLIEGETRMQRLIECRGLSPRGMEIAAVATPDLPLVRRCQEGHPLYISQADFDPVTEERCRSERLISLAVLPIVHDRKVIASLVLASRTKGEFSSVARLAMETIAMRIGGSIARVQAEESRAETESRFRAIFENASVGIGLSDTEGRILDVNQALADMEGRTQEEIIGHQFSEFTTSDDAEAQQKLIQDIIEGRIDSYDFEKRYLHKDGTQFWVRNHCSAVPGAAGERPKYLVSIIENIDARKRAEEMLRESEHRYRLIAENASDVVWAARWAPPDLSNGLPEGDPKTMVEALLRGWHFEYISPSLEKVLGYRAEESISDTPITRMDPAWYPVVAKILVDNLQELKPSQIFEFPLITKEGASRWCEVTVNILPSEPGEALRMMGILRDITSRHEAEEALRKSESQVRGLFENMPDFVLLVDQDATIRYVNHGSAAVAAESLLGQYGFSFIHESSQSLCREAFIRALTCRETQNVEALTVFGNYWSCRIVPMVMEDAVDHVMIICTDITAEKKAAQAVLEEQKLLRQLIDLHERERKFLSYEIHDGFAQQITGALFHLEAFQRLRESDLPLAERNFEQAAAMIRRSIDETRRLISGLRPPILDESGILAAVEYLICECRERSGIDIMFRHELKAVRLAAPLESAVFRIVQESLTNACRHSQSDFIRVELSEADDRLQVVVFDEGVGFDPAAVPGERFGLRNIRERARLLGGEATVEAAPGEGCRISVELPLIPAEFGD